MSQITETVEMLDSFIKQVDNFKGKIQDIENQINSFDRSALLEIEHNLEKAIQQKEDQNQKIITFENDITQVRSKITKLLMDIESKLQKFSNTRYIVEKSLKIN